MFFDSHAGVVVGDAAGLVDDAVGEEDIAFGPVDLEVAGGDRGEVDAGFVGAELVAEGDAVVVGEVEFGGVVGVHEDGVAGGAIEGIDFGVDEGVELFAATGADFKFVGGAVEVWKIDRPEVGFAVGGRKFPIAAEM